METAHVWMFILNILSGAYNKVQIHFVSAINNLRDNQFRPVQKAEN